MPFTPQQLAFQELFIGTLIYATVLGLFNDYTDIVEAWSFSTILFASFALEVMTYLAFRLKSAIIRWLKGGKGFIYRALMFFASGWLCSCPNSSSSGYSICCLRPIFTSTASSVSCSSLPA